MPASSSKLSPPRFLDAGESAVVVEFGRAVDVALHDRVLALDAALGAAKIPGITETVPTYRSLMVRYEPRVLGRGDVVEQVRALLERAWPVSSSPSRRTVPVCFEPPYAEDLAEAAEKLGLEERRVVEIFAQATYRLYMYGFLPGYAYLGRLPKELQIPRREKPRSAVPPGAVLIAGEQVVIAGVASPTGWHMIGRTPLRVLDLERERPFIFDVGDEVAIEAIGAAAFEQ